MKLLDLFCGAGGAAMGYARAGFTVVGADNQPQPHYPFEFHQADAMTYPLDGFDVIHASPPCQAYSVTRHSHNKTHPELLHLIRERLIASGKPWVIENVPGAPMNNPIMLCGTSFGLNAWDEKSGKQLWLRRHRLFESPDIFYLALPDACTGREIGGVYGGGPSNRNPNWGRGGYTPPNSVRKELMGIDWMTQKELSEAIPPAYTQYIGEQLMSVLTDTVTT